MGVCGRMCSAFLLCWAEFTVSLTQEPHFSLPALISYIFPLGLISSFFSLADGSATYKRRKRRTRRETGGTAEPTLIHRCKTLTTQHPPQTPSESKCNCNSPQHSMQYNHISFITAFGRAALIRLQQILLFLPLLFYHCSWILLSLFSVFFIILGDSTRAKTIRKTW